MRKCIYMGALCVVLAGCNHMSGVTSTVSKTNFFGADAAIAPFERQLTVGGIYTTIGNPKKLVSGARIDQFCDTDTEYYAPALENAGVIADSRVEKIDGNALLNIGAVQFPGFKAGLNVSGNYEAEYTLAEVSRSRLANSEVEVERLLSKIGDGCKRFINKYKAQGRDVFVLLEGYKVKSVDGKIARKFDAEAGVTVEAGGQSSSPIEAGAGGNVLRTIKASDVYVEVSGYFL